MIGLSSFFQYKASNPECKSSVCLGTFALASSICLRKWGAWGNNLCRLGKQKTVRPCGADYRSTICVPSGVHVAETFQVFFP
jgi:hypothetical protein